MSKLSELKERAEELCPFPIGPWRSARFDLTSPGADSAFAFCPEQGAMLSVMIDPPKGSPHIVLLEGETTTPLYIPGEETEQPAPKTDDEPEEPQQLVLW